jgi:hypothetical protein
VKTIPVEVVGPSYKDRSPQFSNQRTQNMYLGPGRDTKWAAYDFYGCKPFLSRSGIDRGLYVFQDQLYQVSSGQLIRIASDGTVTALGAVTSTNRCLFDDDGLNLFITTGADTFVYNGSTVSMVTSSNLESPVSVNYLNGFFLYDGDEGRFQASEVGDGTTINDLSVGVANSNGDGILRGLVHDQLVYWYGSRSIEPWYFSGTGDLPFDRLEQGIIQMGLGATYSLADDKDAMYCLGADRQFYKISRSVAQPISTPAVREVEGFTTISDAIGWTLTLENQQFYWVTFPSESRSFLYSITLNYWVDLSYGMEGARHLANSYAYCYGKHFVADYRNGNIYQLDEQTFTDNGQPRLRWRDMAPITGAMIGVPGNQVTSGGLQLDMEVGVGLATGQGIEPVLMCSSSGDGGKIFGEEIHVPIGIMGAYRHKPMYDHFITGYSIVHRIGCSDPVYFSLFGGLGSVADGGY